MPIWITIISHEWYDLYCDADFKQWPGPVFCLLLRVSSDYAQPITGQVTEVTCPVIGWAQPELTWSKRHKMGPGAHCYPSSISESVHISGKQPQVMLYCTSQPFSSLLMVVVWWQLWTNGMLTSGPVFCLLFGVSSDYAQPITCQVTEVTCPVIGWAQPELSPSKRKKTGPEVNPFTIWYIHRWSKGKVT